MSFRVASTRKKTDLAINQWRASRIFTPGTKKTYLDRVMSKAEKLAESASLAKEKSIDIANKEVYALSPEGIADAKAKKLKQEVAAAAARKMNKELWLNNPDNAGKNYAAPRAPPKPSKVNSTRTTVAHVLIVQFLGLQERLCLGLSAAPLRTISVIFDAVEVKFAQEYITLIFKLDAGSCVEYKVQLCLWGCV